MDRTKKLLMFFPFLKIKDGKNGIWTYQQNWTLEKVLLSFFVQSMSVSQEGFF